MKKMLKIIGISLLVIIGGFIIITTIKNIMLANHIHIAILGYVRLKFGLQIFFNRRCFSFNKIGFNQFHQTRASNSHNLGCAGFGC